jgi:hypothetical protein
LKNVISGLVSSLSVDSIISIISSTGSIISSTGSGTIGE